MKRVFETAECEAVRNSIFLVQRFEKHENQMKGCAVKLKVSDWQINAWTSSAFNAVKGQQGMEDDLYVVLWRLSSLISLLSHMAMISFRSQSQTVRCQDEDLPHLDIEGRECRLSRPDILFLFQILFNVFRCIFYIVCLIMSRFIVYLCSFDLCMFVCILCPDSWRNKWWFAVVGEKNSAEIQAELHNEWHEHDGRWRCRVSMLTASEWARLVMSSLPYLCSVYLLS